MRGSDPRFEAKRRRWVAAGAAAGVVAAVFGLTVGDLHVAVELVAPPGKPLTPEAASLLRITGGLLGPPLVAAGWVFARGLRWSARGSGSRALDAAWIAATAFAVAHAALAVTDLVLAMAGRTAAFVAMCAAWYQAARAPSREGRIASRAR